MERPLRREQRNLWDREDLVVEEAPEAGILRRVRTTKASPQKHFEGTFFAPAAQRPVNYPATLPFVPQVEFSFTQLEEGVSIVDWFTLADQGVTELVTDLVRDEGWESLGEPGGIPAEILSISRIILFRRGDRWLYLTSSKTPGGSSLRLVDTMLGRPWPGF